MAWGSAAILVVRKTGVTHPIAPPREREGGEGGGR